MERCVVCDASILSYEHHLKSSPQCFPSNSPDVSPSRSMSMARCSVCDTAIFSYEHHLKFSPKCYPSISANVSPVTGKTDASPRARDQDWEDVETTEPGWYESPDNPALARYWDGEDWDEKSDSRYEVLIYEAFIESMGKQEDLVEAIRIESIMQTEHLKRIRSMVTSFWLVLAITLVGGFIAANHFWNAVINLGY